MLAGIEGQRDGHNAEAASRHSDHLRRCQFAIHQHFGIHASSRLSFGACSTPEEVDRFLSAIADVRRYFQR